MNLIKPRSFTVHLLFALVLGFSSWKASALAPVEDIENQSTSSLAQAIPQAIENQAPIQSSEISPFSSSVGVSAAIPNNLSTEQRLARLEQQMQNLIQMNLPQQASELQQKMQQVSGQLQEQQHDLKLLSEQQRTFYQDLNQRLDQLKNGLPSGVTNKEGSNKPVSPSANTSAKTNTASASETNEAASVKESTAYQNAFNLLTQQHYDKSESAFQDYLSHYPSGKYTANATYWLGEIYFSKKDNKNAEKEFQAVVNQFPQSSKIADTKLKLAIIHANMGKKSQAIQELNNIKKQYAGSAADQLATIQLQQLKAASS